MTADSTSGHGPIRRAYNATYGRLFAATYDKMLEKAEERRLGERRSEVVSQAAGDVLEVGAGTGLNLPHYRAESVTSLTITEPFEPMARQLRDRLCGLPLEAEVVEAPAEWLPFGDASFDTVVSTLVLCTVDDQPGALAEIVRVLKPGGRLLFVEHVRAETPGLARAQDILHRPWWFVGHGCHCNRETVAEIERAGLEPEAIERELIGGLAPLVRPFATGSARRPG